MKIKLPSSFLNDNIKTALMNCLESNLGHNKIAPEGSKYLALSPMAKS